MLRAATIIIGVCLIAWAVGFFLFGVGMIIHALLIVAVIVAAIKIFSTNKE